MSNSRTGVCDSSVTSGAPEASCAANSVFGGRNTRSQTMAVFGVEQLVDGLEAEVRHPHEVGVREGQRDAQLAAVRLADESHFLRQKVAGALALLPDWLIETRMCERGNEQVPGQRAGPGAALETPTLSRPVGLCSVPPAQKAGLRHQDPESGLGKARGIRLDLHGVACAQRVDPIPEPSARPVGRERRQSTTARSGSSDGSRPRTQRRSRARTRCAWRELDAAPSRRAPEGRGRGGPAHRRPGRLRGHRRLGHAARCWV